MPPFSGLSTPPFTPPAGRPSFTDTTDNIVIGNAAVHNSPYRWFLRGIQSYQAGGNGIIWTDGAEGSTDRIVSNYNAGYGFCVSDDITNTAINAQISLIDNVQCDYNGYSTLAQGGGLCFDGFDPGGRMQGIRQFWRRDLFLQGDLQRLPGFLLRLNGPLVKDGSGSTIFPAWVSGTTYGANSWVVSNGLLYVTFAGSASPATVAPSGRTSPQTGADGVTWYCRGGEVYFDATSSANNVECSLRNNNVRDGSAASGFETGLNTVSGALPPTVTSSPGGNTSGRASEWIARLKIGPLALTSYSTNPTDGSSGQKYQYLDFGYQQTQPAVSPTGYYYVLAPGTNGSGSGTYADGYHLQLGSASRPTLFLDGQNAVINNIVSGDALTLAGQLLNAFVSDFVHAAEPFDQV